MLKLYSYELKILRISKREGLVTKYDADLKEKCSVDADMDLLTNVTIGCGPSIYNADAATGSDAAELAP